MGEALEYPRHLGWIRPEAVIAGTVVGPPCGSTSILGSSLAERAVEGFVGFVGWSPTRDTARVSHGGSDGAGSTVDQGRAGNSVKLRAINPKIEVISDVYTNDRDLNT